MLLVLFEPKKTAREVLEEKVGGYISPKKKSRKKFNRGLILSFQILKSKHNGSLEWGKLYACISTRWSSAGNVSKYQNLVLFYVYSQ